MVYGIILGVTLLGSVILCVFGGWTINYWNYFFTSPLWLTGVIVDNCSLAIFLMLILCFGFVLNYVSHYFGGGLAVNYITPLICVFVGVMGVLVFTGDPLLTLIFWEYLGVVSFFLILFYLSYLSVRASIITLVSSRFGDVCLFLVIALVIHLWPNSLVLCLCLFFVVCTKSASFPFISWLLEAMRAPTPVSSLVHSSTLVAAGVWFSLRYGVGGGWGESEILFLFLISTVFITGIASFFFFDLKKIVALSTCNNINWCLIYLIMGGFWLSLFQLICHGVSKCLLFMLVGDVMSGAGGSQSSNYTYSPINYGRYGSFGLVCVILGLSGAPFIGVYFTKHIMLSTLISVHSFILSLCIFFGVLLSYLYSFRLCRMLVSVRISSSLGVMYTCAALSSTYWWLFLNFFVGASLDENSSLSGGATQLILGFQVLSCLICWGVYNSVIITSWCSSLFGVDNLIELAYGWFYNISFIVRVCIFRWDSYCLSLCPSNLSWASLRAINPLISLIAIFLIMVTIIV
uniref:NADH:ubiquinone reductase (H(+)-translocating) n=1 Tax=Khawia sinensis TaxID=125900 RepID=A0A343ESS6_9CEST|nr:NADH dehydrogenase subunit 5 [Khawia sinensis]